MKVLNLRCAHQHTFEGWFASEEDFQSQCARGLVECPLCGDTAIAKLPSAPRLNLRGAEPAATASDVPQPSADMRAALQAAWLAAARRAAAQAEDVGERFAEEARRIHYGEVPERGIRGRATAAQAVELVEEGIDVMPLPWPAAAKGPLQ
ncbi:DUF1178 family protein [Ramlibacter sp. H39-3-26]|uniref:DUF1178 family protein n=1 Tax=Curvibacter soli TaxID=3031331 RepID=UPI0023DA94D0|nr:DUF1178 family protein [Ramlibacter sp. H39-3-26]MDF1483974.1 DUF1178 family protein [Ramlibacter sp. H39-3-26]